MTIGIVTLIGLIVARVIVPFAVTLKTHNISSNWSARAHLATSPGGPPQLIW